MATNNTEKTAISVDDTIMPETYDENKWKIIFYIFF
jgi:hypothetical protein